MTPEQLRARQLAGQAAGQAGAANTKIAPEMKALLVKQAAEAAAAQAEADIDAHNARIELRERHVEEARKLGEKLKPAAAAAPAHDEKHAKPHKGKHREE